MSSYNNITSERQLHDAGLGERLWLEWLWLEWLLLTPENPGSNPAIVMNFYCLLLAIEKTTIKLNRGRE